MKDIKESIFRRNKKFHKDPHHKPAFHSDFQQWDNWCGEIISNLVGALEMYRKEHPDIDPNTDKDFPTDFDEEVLKYANEHYEFWNTLECLYMCYYNGDFTEEDVGGFMPKVKFIK